MKLIALAAAALVALTGTAASAAPVQDRVVVRERTTVTPNRSNTRVTVRERTTTTTNRGYYRPRYRWRTVCRTSYRYGERRRVCRRVRYRY